MEILIFVGGTVFGILVGSIAGYGSAMTKVEQARQEGFMMAFGTFTEMAQKAMDEQKPKVTTFPGGKKSN